MTSSYTSHPWEDLRRLAELGDASQLHLYLGSTSDGEAARASAT